MKQASLYIVATPIGNRSDMSERAIEVLNQVDLIAAEDTRHSRHLLQFYNIKTPMVPYHDHNEQQQTPVLIEKLLAGDRIALISDAGTPLMSDPGYRLVKSAHEAGIQVSPVPGSCAAIAALSASGLATDRFCFMGFPPSKSGARKHFFQSLQKDISTLVFYESCHRIESSLKDMAEIFGSDREAVVAREVTKAFETINKDSLSNLVNWVMADENQRKGEFVVIVQGVAEEPDEMVQVDIEGILDILLAELSVKQASHLAAQITGMKKNKVYQLALSKKEKQGS